MSWRRLLPLLLSSTAALTLSAPWVPLYGTPGYLDVVTYIKGVEVGAITLIRGDDRLLIGRGPVCTGVTVHKLTELLKRSPQVK
jgi:hypothetical protein